MTHHFRYAALGKGCLTATNRLLGRGWRPVREIILSKHDGDPDSPATSAVVLLEKESAESGKRESDTRNFAEAIYDVPLFAGLTVDEFQELALLGDEHRFAAGEVIFVEGDESRILNVVLRGEVEVTLSNLPFEDAEITRLGPKSVFGESTFFSPAPHSATVTCVSDVLTYCLTREAYEELLQLQPRAAFQIAENAAKILAARLQETNDWLWELLREEQESQVTASWRRFRDRIRHVRN